MSKAFTKEDDSQPSEPFAVPLAPLPAGVPNYVTPRGVRLLRERLEVARASARPTEVRALERRLERCQLVTGPPPNPTRVFFGTCVGLRYADGRTREVQLVGVDEADAAKGRISFLSPLGSRLLGTSRGDELEVQTPGGIERIEVVAVQLAGEQRSETPREPA